MAAKSLLGKIAIGVVVLLMVNGATAFVGFFNSNKLGEALTQLNTSKEYLEQLKSELNEAKLLVDDMRGEIVKQQELIEILDNQVEINYKQFKARLDQPNFDKRIQKLKELDELYKATEKRKERILAKLNPNNDTL